MKSMYRGYHNIPEPGRLHYHIRSSKAKYFIMWLWIKWGHHFLAKIENRFSTFNSVLYTAYLPNRFYNPLQMFQRVFRL